MVSQAFRSSLTFTDSPTICTLAILSELWLSNSRCDGLRLVRVAVTRRVLHSIRGCGGPVSVGLGWSVVRGRWGREILFSVFRPIGSGGRPAFTDMPLESWPGPGRDQRSFAFWVSALLARAWLALSHPCVEVSFHEERGRPACLAQQARRSCGRLASGIFCFCRSSRGFLLFIASFAQLWTVAAYAGIGRGGD